MNNVGQPSPVRLTGGIVAIGESKQRFAIEGGKVVISAKQGLVGSKIAIVSKGANGKDTQFIPATVATGKSTAWYTWRRRIMVVKLRLVRGTLPGTRTKTTIDLVIQGKNLCRLSFLQ